MIRTANDLRREFRLAQDLWNQRNPNDRINLVTYWDESFLDLLSAIVSNLRTNAEHNLAEVTRWCSGRGGQMYEQGLAIVRELVQHITQSSSSIAGLD